ncbi:hypothetical protein [Prochlorococcus marinus]|uniref:Uncharacterized protein n=1 Tax=Prochlorococcus marinus (strain MIT 9303) TaxID=59922 RepID=A2CCG4_PROM3|nr:hypothetical protein [Prochlorococcus marinus]ABM79174.1 Conserved hypothetical protein [Prochlorococcus marinus str. MIT 9303]
MIEDSLNAKSMGVQSKVTSSGTLQTTTKATIHQGRNCIGQSQRNPPTNHAASSTGAHSER